MSAESNYQKLQAAKTALGYAKMYGGKCDECGLQLPSLYAKPQGPAICAMCLLDLFKNTPVEDSTGDAPYADIGISLDENFGDPETLLNSRDWLQSALEDKGAKMTGGGIGLGQADIDIELEGCRFNVSIRPL